ncbi:hypothetical protein [Mycobacterium avium]|uniref:hypothetical protein n=1 Tax=Mycobacterium avium TaxID=1764 RepID=UPI000448A89D|nr:hypothetical protein [Mycobacterium avium]ETZ57713.1 hypothetical protein L838_0033 [Mycobacterium avium MAV_120709_2344]MCA4732915.1 hypothetical protein [Mycobacterium avium subsp. hominissuis]MCA4741367.1 hypothetical protein [Mycobacterium avium subsp. hominissuis]MCA4746186.1 hypothetical protein [Mycobacterium avium subsp. hominissuis]QXD05772.1 hypothetical protein BB735_023430 [Mycobacterium avium subsp. hominissuis]
MATTEGLILLNGDEGVRQCPECCASAFSLHSRYYANDTHYHLKAEIECANGHTRTVVGPSRPLDDEMRKLLD